MVLEGDLTSGGKHIAQYTGDLLQNCISETYNFFSNQCDPKKLMEVDLCAPTDIIFMQASTSKCCGIYNMTVIIVVDICIETWKNKDTGA